MKAAHSRTPASAGTKSKRWARLDKMPMLAALLPIR